LATPTLKAQSGKVRPLAIMSAHRSTAFPNVPTVAESGFPGYGVTTYYGIAGPAGIDPEIVGKLNKEIRAAVEDPKTKHNLNTIGAEVDENVSSADAFMDYMKKDGALWRKVIEDSGVTPK